MTLPITSPSLQALRMFNNLPENPDKQLVYLFKFVMRCEALRDFDTIAAVLALPWERKTTLVMTAVLRSTWMYTHNEQVREAYKLARLRIHVVLVEREGDDKAARLLRNLLSDDFRTER